MLAAVLALFLLLVSHGFKIAITPTATFINIGERCVCLFDDDFWTTEGVRNCSLRCIPMVSCKGFLLLNKTNKCSLYASVPETLCPKGLCGTFWMKQ